MRLSNLIRWGGLAAVLGGVLFISADLLTLLSGLGQRAAGGLFVFRAVLGLLAGVLLLLGLIGLYARHSEALGLLGLVGFLAVFFGLTLGQQNLIWASVLSRLDLIFWASSLALIWAPLLANLGWIAFGVACLAARAYSRAAVMVLITGALLSAVVNTLINTLTRSGALLGRPLFVVVAMVVDIVFETAVVWLGISLFARRGEEQEQQTSPLW